MNSQLYTAASGLVVERTRLELVAHNLANAGTAGFRSQRAFSSVYEALARSSDDPRLRAANKAVALAGTYEIPGPAPVRTTGNRLDVALPEDHMLVVETGGGRRYTRAGALHLAEGGSLVDANGHPLLDVRGKPLRDLGAGARIGADATVLDGETELGRLLVVRDTAGLLRPEGNSLYVAVGDDALLETVEDPRLMPGSLETSGADPLGEMVLLIEAQRAFESYQRVIHLTMNDVNRKIINEIAG